MTYRYNLIYNDGSGYKTVLTGMSFDEASTEHRKAVKNNTSKTGSYCVVIDRSNRRSERRVGKNNKADKHIDETAAIDIGEQTPVGDDL